MKIVLMSFYKEITPEYIERRKEELTELQTLISSSDFTNIAAKFHKIAGSGGGYGLDLLSTHASTIEVAAASNDIETINTTFTSYCDYLNNLELEYTED